MTAQFSDTVTYRDEPYDLAGVSGEGLFDPFAHGMAPVSWCTACWRGFVCQYEVADDALRLDGLMLCLTPLLGPGERGETVAAPPLFGKQAERVDDTFEYAYRDLAGPVAFTGGLLLCGEFIRDLYVHMGFHPAWKYERVHELIFDAGRLTSAADRSGEMKELAPHAARTPIFVSHCSATLPARIRRHDCHAAGRFCGITGRGDGWDCPSAEGNEERKETRCASRWSAPVTSGLSRAPASPTRVTR